MNTRHSFVARPSSTHLRAVGRRLIRQITVLATVGFCSASCGDVSGPGEQAREATVLAAASSTRISAPVGHVPVDLPTVIARDSDGNPVSGVPVTFSIDSGGGTVETPMIMSNAAGIARLPNWRLGIRPGTYVVTARSGRLNSVQFVADGVVGSPVRIIKLTGDNQVGASGEALTIHPRVKVEDLYGNAISGLAVQFVVQNGGGSLARSTAVTDAAGIATAGAWTLGAFGEHTLVAQYGDLGVAFTATAESAFACTPQSTLALGGTTRSALSADGCRTGDGRVVELHRWIVAVSGFFLVELASDEFDTYLELRDERLALIAANNNRGPGTGSGVKAFLTAGVYTAVAASMSGGGRYTASVRAISFVSPCEEIVVVRGFETTQGSCASPDGSGRYRLYMKAGATLTVATDGLFYNSVSIQVVTPDGQSLVAAAPTTYTRKLTYEARVSGFYPIVLMDNGSEGFNLSIQ